MLGIRLGSWLRWLRATATFVFIAALCLAVALLVIAFIPGSPVAQELPAAALTGPDRVGGVTDGFGFRLAHAAIEARQAGCERGYEVLIRAAECDGFQELFERNMGLAFERTGFD